MRFPLVSLLFAPIVAASLVAAPQSTPLMPIEDVRPGMVGIGRTVYVGHELEEFRVTVLGVMRNIIGPKRNLILARLEGGPLANTGVIQGMSGSPVYIDGRLVGAVSYSLGSFPKEPIAGITPIAEMIEDIGSRAPRSSTAVSALSWPATPAQVFDALGRIARRAASPLTPLAEGSSFTGPASMADLVPQLRPIGAAFTLAGFDTSVSGRFEQALQATVGQSQAAAPGTAGSTPLRPGDPVGMSLVRGDFEMGATGTVTHVDGSRVYAFGHPFLNLGPTQLAMTEAHVVTVLPSLDSSMKLASMGRIIGTITQDRATAVGGTLGAGPAELRVRLRMNSPGTPSQTFEFFVLNDPALTPIFTFSALLNALTTWERQTGTTTVAVRGSVSLGPDGTVDIDDVFTGTSALSLAASAIATPLGILMPNPFRTITADGLTVEIDTAEVESYTTIERAWLDTVRPAAGGTYRVNVQLRDYRGGTRVIDIPVTMPMRAGGPLTLLVSDAPTLQTLEDRDFTPGPAATWQDLLARTRNTRRGNRVYVRLIDDAVGTVLGGEVMPSLPGSVQSAVQADPTTARTRVSKSFVGAWEHRTDRVVRGSRELTLTLDPAR
jgi:hypothetical protein